MKKIRYIRLDNAWDNGINTISPLAQLTNRHNTEVEDMYVILDPFTIRYGMMGVHIKRGFCTDFASIPKFAQWIAKPDDHEVRVAACFHDACYNAHYLPWRDSNRAFRDITITYGLPKLRADLLYLGIASPIGKKHYVTDTVFDRENKQFSNKRNYKTPANNRQEFELVEIEHYEEN